MRRTIGLIVILISTALILTPAVLALEPYEQLPVDVINYPDRLEVRKIYEMSVDTDPAEIPRDDFIRSGVRYTCTDIIREVVIGSEVRTYNASETIDSSSNDIDTVLSVLPITKDVFTEDGFSGTLRLDTSSIISEVSGYGSRTRTVSVTRSYPNLSGADTQFIPKTVTDGNRTYTLENVQWQTDSIYNADDYEIGNRYTATAVYTGTATSRFIKGFTITASYIGEISRSGVSLIRYTVIFTGTPAAVQTPESAPDPGLPEPQTPVPAMPAATPAPVPTVSSSFSWLFILLPVLGLIAGTALTLLFTKKYKERKQYAQDSCYDNNGRLSDGCSDSTCSGGRL